MWGRAIRSIIIAMLEKVCPPLRERPDRAFNITIETSQPRTFASNVSNANRVSFHQSAVARVSVCVYNIETLLLIAQRQYFQLCVCVCVDINKKPTNARVCRAF